MKNKKSRSARKVLWQARPTTQEKHKNTQQQQQLEFGAGSHNRYSACWYMCYAYEQNTDYHTVPLSSISQRIPKQTEGTSEGGCSFLIHSFFPFFFNMLSSRLGEGSHVATSVFCHATWTLKQEELP